MIRDLEIRHCRALVAVHDNGGIGAAARALGIAQSTVSETLLSLERLVGVRMTLPRAGRGAKLTAAAEALLPHAQKLIAGAEAALAAVSGQDAAAIRLGTVESISSFLLPGPISGFRQLWPEIDVRITIGLCEDLRARVARGELDLALTVEQAGPAFPGAAGMWPAALCLIVSPDHPLARRGVDARDLTGRTLLLADPDGGFNQLLSAWLDNGANPPKLESAGSVDGVKWGVLNGDAIGVLPDYAIAGELAAGSCVMLKTRLPLPAIALRATSGQSPAPASPMAYLIDKISAAVGGKPSPAR
jgi:DNA-binding transcriptional LysR family regulator